MYSDEHQKYIKKLKKEKEKIIILRIGIIFLIIFFWQFLVDKEILNSFIFSSPLNIFKTITFLIKNHNLFNNIYITIYETIISFFLATIFGIIIASLLWSSKLTAKIFDPFLTIINSLPKVSLGPIIIVWFGANIKSIIIMAILITLMTSVISIYQGFKEVDYNLIILMKSFKATKNKFFLNLFYLTIMPI